MKFLLKISKLKAVFDSMFFGDNIEVYESYKIRLMQKRNQR